MNNDNIAGRCRYARAQRRALSLIDRVIERFHRRNLSGSIDLAKYLSRSIGREVIDDNDFLFVRSLLDTLQNLRDRLLFVINGNNDAQLHCDFIAESFCWIRKLPGSMSAPL